MDKSAQRLPPRRLLPANPYLKQTRWEDLKVTADVVADLDDSTEATSRNIKKGKGKQGLGQATPPHKRPRRGRARGGVGSLALAVF